MSKKSKKLKQFSIKVYEDAEGTVERILINAITDFKRIITAESQQRGDIADPHLYYDKPTKSLVIEQFQEDRGKVLVLTGDDKRTVSSVAYKDVPVHANYAQLDNTAGCYRVYVKQETIDHPVNVALDEDTLVEVFETVTHDDLLPEEVLVEDSGEESPLKVASDE